MRRDQSAILEVNVAALLLGAAILFPKLITLSAPSIIFVRALFAAVAMLLYSFLWKRALDIPPWKDTLMIVGMGMVLAIHWVLLFYAIQISTVAVAGLAFYTYPVMTALLEPLLSRSRLESRDIFLASLAFAGVLLLMPSFTLDSDMTMGVLAGLGSALLFAVRNIYNRPYVKRYSGSTVMVYQLCVVPILLWPLLDFEISAVGGSNWMLLILLATVFTALPHTLYTVSLGTLSARTVGIIASVQPMYAAVFAAFLLKEIPTIRTVIGGLIIVVCSLVESLKQSGKMGK